MIANHYSQSVSSLDLGCFPDRKQPLFLCYLLVISGIMAWARSRHVRGIRQISAEQGKNRRAVPGRIRAVRSRAVLLAALLTSFGVVAAANAAETLPGPFPATFDAADPRAIYDGDTFTLTARIWLDQWAKARIRLDGVDTPEMRGKCDAEREQARAAKAFARQALASASVITIHDVRHGKYAGRVVARVMIDGRDLARLLIDAGLGREYHGEKRKGWCDAD